MSVGVIRRPVKRRVRTPLRKARSFDSASETRYVVTDAVRSANGPFESADIWTTITFFRDDGGAGDDHHIMGQSGAAGSRVFQFVLTQEVSPKDVQVYINSQIVTDLLNIIVEDEWYCGAATCDGNDNIELHVVRLSTGKHFSNTGSKTSTQSNDGNAYLGSRGPSAGDAETGDLSHSAYFNRVLTDTEIRQYCYDPLAVVERNWRHVEFYIPWGHGSDTGTEPDFGPYGRDATLDNGTATSVIAFGPSVRLASLRPFFLPIAAAAGGGATPKGPLGHPLHGPFGGPI